MGRFCPCQTITKLPNTSAPHCRAHLAKGAPECVIRFRGRISAVNYGDMTASHADLLVRDLNWQRWRSERRY